MDNTSADSLVGSGGVGVKGRRNGGERRDGGEGGMEVREGWRRGREGGEGGREER